MSGWNDLEDTLGMKCPWCSSGSVQSLGWIAPAKKAQLSTAAARFCLCAV